MLIRRTEGASRGAIDTRGILRRPRLARASAGQSERTVVGRTTMRNSLAPKRLASGTDARWRSGLSRRAHNPKIVGSNPTRAMQVRTNTKRRDPRQGFSRRLATNEGTIMPFTKGWYRGVEEKSREAHVADVAARVRRCGRIPCTCCGLPATVYCEASKHGVGSFRCRVDSLGFRTHFGPGAIVEPIREVALDLYNELRYQGRVNAIVEQDEARRDRYARGEGLLTVEEFALLNIAYDRGESAESFAAKILGSEQFYLATADSQ